MGLTKWLTVIVLFTIFASFSQVKSADFKRLIQQYKNSKALENSQWALLAIDADNGQIIIDHQSKFALAPASCQKLITTGVALKLLGADFRFKTQILADGKITRDGMLNGNLIIKGNGDPTLGSNIVKGSLPLDSLMLSWLQDIKQKGFALSLAILSLIFLYLNLNRSLTIGCGLIWVIIMALLRPH